MELLNILLANWEVVGLIITNIAALFAPSPVKPKTKGDLYNG